MGKLRKLARRMMEEAERRISGKGGALDRLRRRARDILNGSQLEERLRIVANAHRAKMLFDEIGARLETANGPEERMDLRAAHRTLRYMAQKGADMPRSVDELLGMERELHCRLHCPPPAAGLPGAEMSEAMLRYAARGEKETMKN